MDNKWKALGHCACMWLRRIIYLEIRIHTNLWDECGLNYSRPFGKMIFQSKQKHNKDEF